MTDLLQSVTLGALCFTLYQHFKSIQLLHGWAKGISDQSLKQMDINGRFFNNLDVRIKDIEQKLDIKPRVT